MLHLFIIKYIKNKGNYNFEVSYQRKRMEYIQSINLFQNHRRKIMRQYLFIRKSLVSHNRRSNLA